MKEDHSVEELEAYLYGKKSVEDLTAEKQEEEHSGGEGATSSEIKIILSKMKEIDRKTEEKFEEIESSLRSLRNAMQEIEREEAPISASKVEEMIALAQDKNKEILRSFEDRLNEMEREQSLAKEDKTEEPDHDMDFNKEEGFEEIEEIEEIFDEVESNEKKNDDYDEIINDEEDSDFKEAAPKKKGSVLKKILFFTLFIFLVLGILIGYTKIRNSDISNTEYPSVQVDPMAHPSSVVTSATATTPSLQEEENMIDPLAVENVKKEAQNKMQQEQQSPITQQAAKSRTREPEGVTKMANSGQQQFAQPAPEEIDPFEERSPIENELLQNHRKAEDIAFKCRLNAKYPAGDYIYYNKAGENYIVNPNDDVVAIGEKNILFNYSPESKFIKVEKNKYLKTKLFTNCKAVVPVQ